jgi:KilA-N domain
MKATPSKTSTLAIQGTTVTVVTSAQGDYISLTDIARYRNAQEPSAVINNWMRSRSTIEFLGLWEKLSNPTFKPLEFERFKNEAGSNYFVLSPQRWIESTQAIGNQRDNATLEQLVVLTNLESLNAVFIRQGLPAPDRLQKLNEIAISQMRSLLADHHMKRLAS